MNRTLFVATRTTLLAAAAVAGLAVAPAVAQAPAGSAFTYQGRLDSGGGPATGTYDLAFRLFDAATAGVQVGGVVLANDLAVTDGVFTTLLDFGGVAFAPDARWLEIGVRDGTSTGTYTVLAPRQQITPTPVALYALNGEWAKNGLEIHNTNIGNVGVGIVNPQARLDVQTTGLVDNVPDVLRLVSNSIESLQLTTHYYLKFVQCTINSSKAVNNDAETNNPLSLNNFVAGNVLLANGGGNVGVGATAPAARLHVYDSNDATAEPLLLQLESNQGSNPFDSHYSMEFSSHEIDCYDEENGDGETLYLNYNSDGDVHMAFGGGNVGVGTFPLRKFHVEASPLIGFESTDLANDDAIIEAEDAWMGLYSDDEGGAGSGIVLGEVHPTGGVSKWAIYRRTESNVNDLNITYGSDPNPTANEKMFQILPDGTTKIQILEITGADVAERFPCSEPVEPGSVVMIDAANPGQLCLSRGAYNRKVAGVISGAGDIPVGAILGNMAGLEKAPAVALSGRVWVKCDASEHAIEPGDLMTTADAAGHAMKAADSERSHGATIGKAMSSLAQGEQGLVLVLVNLQ